jgi:hypothetical protein
MENIYFSDWLTACLLPICQSVFLSVCLYVVPASLFICLPFWLSVCQSDCLSVFLPFCPSFGLQLSAGCPSFLNIRDHLFYMKVDVLESLILTNVKEFIKNCKYWAGAIFLPQCGTYHNSPWITPHVDGGLKERHALVSKVHARAHSSWLAWGGEGAGANYDEGP